MHESSPIASFFFLIFTLHFPESTASVSPTSSSLSSSSILSGLSLACSGSAASSALTSVILNYFDPVDSDL